MTSEQMWMLVALLSVGGGFLLVFFLIRRYLDRREELLARRLGPGTLEPGSNRGGETLGGGDACAKFSDSGTKLGDSAYRLGGSPAPSLHQAGTRLSQPDYGPTGATVLQLGQKSVSAEDSELRQRDGLSDRFDQAFNRMVERTGFGWEPDQALGIVCLVGVLVGAGLYLWKEEIWLALIGLVLGLALPLGALMLMQARWQRQLQDQLPDAFFFFARSLRAGLSLDQAVTVAGTQGARPLADEFQRCAERVRLGLPVSTALELTARRPKLLDFDVFVSLVALHQTTGGNLALQLDRLATSVRDRNQYQGYFRSATALGKITAIAIGSAVPIIFLGYTLFQPEFALKFFESGAGIAMLAIAFSLEIVGAIWLYLLLKVSY